MVYFSPADKDSFNISQIYNLLASCGTYTYVLALFGNVCTCILFFLSRCIEYTLQQNAAVSDYTNGKYVNGTIV